MASSITRLVRRPVAALFLLKSYRHVRSFSHHFYPGITAQGCPNSRRELCGFLPRVSQYELWSRSFSSDNADLAEAVVPFMGESITDGTLATFLKKPGDRVAVDEPIAQIETDKVTIDVVSPEAGVIEKFVAKEGDTVTPGTKIAFISKSDSSDTHVTPSEKPDHDTPKSDAKEEDKAKSNVEEQIKEKPSVVTEIKEKPKVASSAPPKLSASEPQLPPKERERRVSMPRIRKRVATRLKDSQNTYAMLTTFNEVDM